MDSFAIIQTLCVIFVCIKPMYGLPMAPPMPALFEQNPAQFAEMCNEKVEETCPGMLYDVYCTAHVFRTCMVEAMGGDSPSGDMDDPPFMECEERASEACVTEGQEIGTCLVDRTKECMASAIGGCRAEAYASCTDGDEENMVWCVEDYMNRLGCNLPMIHTPVFPYGRPEREELCKEAAGKKCRSTIGVDAVATCRDDYMWTCTSESRLPRPTAAEQVMREMEKRTFDSACMLRSAISCSSRDMDPSCRKPVEEECMTAINRLLHKLDEDMAMMGGGGDDGRDEPGMGDGDREASKPDMGGEAKDSMDRDMDGHRDDDDDDMMRDNDKEDDDSNTLEGNVPGTGGLRPIPEGPEGNKPGPEGPVGNVPDGPPGNVQGPEPMSPRPRPGENMPEPGGNMPEGNMPEPGGNMPIPGGNMPDGPPGNVQGPEPMSPRPRPGENMPEPGGNMPAPEEGLSGDGNVDDARTDRDKDEGSDDIESPVRPPAPPTNGAGSGSSGSSSGDNIQNGMCDFKFRPWECNFGDGDFCGMKQDTSEQQDWLTGKKTPSGGTGPGRGYDDEYFMYIETSGNDGINDGDIARIELPISCVEAGMVCLRFRYHMFGPHIGTLAVVVKDGSGSMTEPWSMQGPQGNEWKDSGDISLALKVDDKVYISGQKKTEHMGDSAVDKLSIKMGKC